MNKKLQADEVRPSGSSVYQMVTGEDVDGDRMRWDKFYNTEDYMYGKKPALLLQEQFAKIGRLQGGHVLDLAMGEGRNAVFLARHGFVVDGVDISAIALRKARRLARESGVAITTIVADLNKYKIKPEFYSVIINFDYLQRNLIISMKQGLKRGGIIFFEYPVWIQDGPDQAPDKLDDRSNKSDKNEKRTGVTRRADLLRPNELKDLFKDFKILHYQEVKMGAETKARLIAEKPDLSENGTINPHRN